MASRSRLIESELLSPWQGVRYPELLRLHKSESAQHIVQFYEDESPVIENVAYLAAEALSAGNSTVLLATQTHLEQLRKQLTSFGLNLETLSATGCYLSLDAAEVLRQISIDGWPDKARFDDVVGGIVRGASKKSANGFVFAFGEMVALLCAADNADAAIGLERLWNSLAERQRFSLYCAYPLNCLGSKPDANALIQICAEHAMTIPTETSL